MATSKNTVGYDVIANDYVDMLEAGIIDPAKVTRSAVENACFDCGDDPDDQQR